MKTIFDIIDRDIIFFDTETTGTIISQDSIVQLVAKKYKMNRTIETKELFINPKKPMPKEAFDVHGLGDEFLSKCQPFEYYADELYDFFLGCDIGGYNVIKFDMALLFDEFVRVGKRLPYANVRMIDSLMLQNKLEPRTLSASYKRYFNEDFDNAHNAMNDVDASIKIFEHQIAIYGLEDKTIQDISDISRCNTAGDRMLDLSGYFRVDKDNEVFFEMGKFKDKNIENAECREYLRWLAYDEHNRERNARDMAIAICKKLKIPKEKTTYRGY